MRSLCRRSCGSSVWSSPPAVPLFWCIGKLLGGITSPTSSSTRPDIPSNPSASFRWLAWPARPQWSFLPATTSSSGLWCGRRRRSGTAWRLPFWSACAACRSTVRTCRTVTTVVCHLQPSRIWSKSTGEEKAGSARFIFSHMQQIQWNPADCRATWQELSEYIRLLCLQITTLQMNSPYLAGLTSFSISNESHINLIILVLLIEW
jgi:hypothetical protein